MHMGLNMWVISRGSNLHNTPLMLLTFYLVAAFWPAKAVMHTMLFHWYFYVFFNVRLQGHVHLSKHPEPRV